MRIRSHMMTIAALALFPFSLAADGGTGAAFLNIDAGADVAAMGGTSASRPASVGAVFWNPGALGWLRGPEFSASHTEQGQSVRCEYLAGAYGSQRLTLALSVQALTLDGLEERTGPSATPLSTFGAVCLAPSLTCAKQFGSRLSAGTSLKLVYQKIGSDQASSFANDIGLSLLPGPSGLRTGAALTNWGSGIRFTDQSSPLPTRLRLGAGYDLLGGDLRLSGDVVKPRGRPLFACLGAEGVIRDRIMLRAGYKGGLTDDGGVAGLSGGIGLVARGFAVDYAAASRGALGLAHHVSLTFRPGAGSEAKAESTIATELQRRARLTAETFYRQGLAQMKAEKLDEAMASFDLALVWDPDFAEAARSLAEAREAAGDREADRYMTSGLAHFKAGRVVDAIADFGRVLEIKPDNQTAREWLRNASDALIASRPPGMMDSVAVLIARHLRAGASLLSAGEYVRAIDEWNGVLALAPGHATARASIDRARTMQRQAVEAALQRAESLEKQERLPAAMALVNRALAMDPGNEPALEKKRALASALRELSDVHARKGIELIARGDYAQAEVELKLALALDKDNRPAADQLSKIPSRRVTASAREISDLYLKGISAYTSEDYEQAIAFWQRVLELDPNHANARRNLDRAREKLRLINQ